MHNDPTPPSTIIQAMLIIPETLPKHLKRRPYQKSVDEVSQHELQQLVLLSSRFWIYLVAILRVICKLMAVDESAGCSTGTSSVDKVEDVDMDIFENLKPSETDVNQTLLAVVSPSCIA
jgi:hypothetical protein